MRDVHSFPCTHRAYLAKHTFAKNVSLKKKKNSTKIIHDMSDKLHLKAGRPENRGSIPSSSVQISCGTNQAS
jgi:hypothetical protein